MSKDCYSWKGQFSSAQSLCRVRFFTAPWTTARQASLSTTNSQSALRPLSMESGLAGWFLRRIPEKDQQVAAVALEQTRDLLVCSDFRAALSHQTKLGFRWGNKASVSKSAILDPSPLALSPVARALLV